MACANSSFIDLVGKRCITFHMPYTYDVDDIILRLSLEPHKESSPVLPHVHDSFMAL
jgi:hypothetical protein